MQPASPVAMDARVLPDVGFFGDASTPDSGPPADAAADAGLAPDAAPDGGPQADGGPGADGGPTGDAGPGLDGGPVGDAGPAADGGPMGDAGPGPDAGPLADGGPGNDGGPANDGGPGPDAGPLADGGPDAGLDAGNDAGPVDVGPIDAGTLAMIPTATTVPMGRSARFVVNAPSGAAVQWQVDGAVGGGTAMGTILPEADPRGAIYTAPTVPGAPAPGSFEVSAVSGAETARAVVNLAYIAPSIATITPTELRSGQGTITVTLTGLGFTPQTQVYLDGLRLALATVRWDQLTFDIAPTLLTFPGPREIRVRNPLPGGGEAVITVLGVLSRTVLDPAVPADAPADAPGLDEIPTEQDDARETRRVPDARPAALHAEPPTRRVPDAIPDRDAPSDEAPTERSPVPAAGPPAPDDLWGFHHLDDTGDLEIVEIDGPGEEPDELEFLEIEDDGTLEDEIATERIRAMPSPVPPRQTRPADRSVPPVGPDNTPPAGTTHSGSRVRPASD